jgi:hypothetical protein
MGFIGSINTAGRGLTLVLKVTCMGKHAYHAPYNNQQLFAIDDKVHLLQFTSLYHWNTDYLSHSSDKA